MAETAYLQENVGEALKMALAAMVVDQPDDAVEFIGTYLVNHATKHEREEARAKKYASLAESIAVSDAAAAEVAAAAEARRTASDPTEAEAELDKELEETDDVESLYPQLMDAVRRQTGCTAAYVGVKGEKEGVPLIGFCGASEGCDMAGNVLKGGIGEDEPAEGVTFDLFQQREEYEEELAAATAAVEEATGPATEAEAPVAEAQAAVDDAQAAVDEKKALEGDDADPEGLAEAEKALEGAQATLAEAQKTLDEAQKTLTEAEAAKDAVLQYPSRAFVANVVREDRIKFFGIPRCGSYCAAAVKYDSALHAEGIGEPVPEEPAEEAPEAPEEGAEPAEEPAPPARAPKNQPVIVPVERVLCVHAMGQAKDLAEDKQLLVEAWAKKLGEAHARADAKRWAASAMLREDAAEAAEAPRAASTAEAEAATAAEPPRPSGPRRGEDGAPDGAEDRAAAEAAVASAEAVLATYADALSELARDKIPPSEAAVASLQASLLVCGVSSESCASFTGAPDWAKVAAALAEAPRVGEGKKDFVSLAADADGRAAEGVDVEAAKAAAEAAPGDDGFYAADALAKLGAWAAASPRSAPRQGAEAGRRRGRGRRGGGDDGAPAL